MGIDAGASEDGAPCEHPWPCADGSEWPVELVGPFASREAEAVRISGHGGVELEGYVWRPELPEGVRAPVVMHAQPYASQCYLGAVCFPRGDDPYWLDTFGLRPILDAGYAIANVNVRGTGTSGGCFDFNGPNEALDLAAAVEWLADQEWSNGRVGMSGISYMGTTPWITANLNPPSLKTIVPGGIVSHEYTAAFTFQGAGYAPTAIDYGLYVAGVGMYPPLGAPQSLVAWTDVAGESLCEEPRAMIARGATDRLGDERDAAYYAERAHIMGFPNITASVFVYHGLRDSGVHRFAEDAVWDTLDSAPRRMILGDWGHNDPTGLLEGYPGGEDWGVVLTAWLDFWLKGVGAPERLNVVDYEDRLGEWRATRAWPPPERDDAAAPQPAGGWSTRRDEVHYFVGDRLAAAPAEEAPAAFWAVLAGGDVTTPLCGAPGTVAVFEGPVLEERVLVAGNPHAYLQVESDGPGGLVAVDLYSVGPDALCVGGQLLGGEWLTGGTADLRFHAGNLAGRDFPVGEPTPVRVDFANLAAAVEPGHRLVAVASGYGHIGKIASPAYPNVRIHAGDGPDASHVVIPLVEGDLGGAAPTLAYPPRPFVPHG